MIAYQAQHDDCDTHVDESYYDDDPREEGFYMPDEEENDEG